MIEPTTRVVVLPAARSVTEYRQSWVLSPVTAAAEPGATAVMPHGSPERAAAASV